MDQIQRYQQLNENATTPDQYTVFFLGRHGEGYHNVIIEKHRQDWDDGWSKLNGNGVMTWGPDAELTLKGEGQADEVHAAWQEELQFGLPLPDKLYCSPLTRAIRTNQRTFSGLLPAGSKRTS
ncbi:hypothetical protein SCLCIDRAFT_1218290 [Scleroderma citrinum Foug A]|uniref:Phosphoglycerate mutase n=1 Tax=Scleroderma citrinum Foug A TaxID=1036808 RepID=A0A0C2ZA54_9AGAM|nr:hypothetical protein SCLCIDRAFT_1218290 [Scleroderma citrinum Foug A]